MKIGDLPFDPQSGQIEPRGQAVGPGLGPGESIVACFARRVASHPHRLAVRDETADLSYAELDREARRIGRFIQARGLARESCIGLMFERNRYFVAAALGVLQAGCAYVPIDPMLPLARRAQLLDRAAAPLLVSQASLIRDLHRLQWQCPALRQILCLDSNDMDSLIEAPGAMMSTELWDHLAGEGADDIAAGGWKSAFTGLPLPAQAMHAFGANARRLAASVLGENARVLEIGCASGFTMRHLAPLAASYLATDISRRNIERVAHYAQAHGLTQVSVRQLAARDIDLFQPGSFDLIVLNSVIENFPGFAYLRQVLDKALKLLAPGGAILAGSVWDLERRSAYLADLAAFARDHAGAGYQTRLDFPEDLFVPQAFFADWAAEQDAPPALSFSAVAAEGFEPARYAYDLLIRPGIQGPTRQAQRQRYDARALDRLDTAPLPTEVAADNLAYVIFTSGTSGQPKGVMIEHRSVVNLAEHVAETLFSLYPAVAEGLNVSAIASFAFDGCVKQIFATLLNGHSLHIPGEETRRDPARLHAFIQERRLDLCDTTPSLFALLLDFWSESGARTSARTFILGGEAVQSELPRRFYALEGHGDARLVNAYGPTETCVAACQHIMTSGNWSAIQPPPIGLPLRGVSIQVCDGNGLPLPQGVPGEIRIGGAGVGRGYLADAELSARSFVTDGQGRIWYRSGDLGRWLSGGLLHFLGREDRQVKIRGNRIELAEVEDAIAAHPLIRQVRVLACDPHHDGNLLLAAYLVPRAGFDLAACKTDLDARLPTYLVPSWLIPLEEIPLTANGKVDEARLPAPETASRPTQTRPAETQTQARLLRIWSEVLDFPVEDIDADFFVLGGHSVLAVRLLAAVERAFGIHLPLADLFAHSSVARLASRIDDSARGSDWHPVVAIHATGGLTPMVCFHPVGGNVLCYQGLAQALGPERPLYMVQSYGLEAHQPLLASVEEMAAAYLRALREVLPGGPLIFAGWSFGGLLAYEAAYQWQRSGQQTSDVLLFDAVAVADPVRDLLRQDEAEYLAILFEELDLVKAEELRPLSPTERLDLILERGQGTDFLPEGMDRAGMRRLLTLFQNNGLAAVRYQPRGLEGRLLLVRPRLSSRQAPGVPGDDYSGWQGLASGGVCLRWMDGSHGQMMEQPYVQQLAGLINEHLRELR
ncbi:AMP-binding protein [Magnetovirga frankeli]|uniref:AMP-binding protein n=1 Tax=Magnetovirga frankeli TaxID=947516 RepID=UPI00129356D2|nr:AMP-binding protein [gamma proteobacterium SS-5]